MTAFDYWQSQIDAGIPQGSRSWRYTSSARRIRIETGEREKFCPKCRKWLPESDFEYWASRCKPCYKMHCR